MNAVDRVKAICKSRKIAIYKLEKDLGYANGYIGQLKKGVFPSDRLIEIANYLGITPEEILIGEKSEEKTAPTVSGGRLEETPNYNVIKICGRDGSYSEKRLTDEELAAFAALFSRLPDASDDL